KPRSCSTCALPPGSGKGVVRSAIVRLDSFPSRSEPKRDAPRAGAAPHRCRKSIVANSESGTYIDPQRCSRPRLRHFPAVSVLLFFANCHWDMARPFVRFSLRNLARITGNWHLNASVTPLLRRSSQAGSKQEVGMLSFGKLRLVVGFFLVGWALGLLAADFKAAGPEGGDVRKLAVVPDNPDRIFLGTSSGRLYVSDDRGRTWTRFAHLGEGFDYVLDNIEIDPTNSQVMYVAGWSIEGKTGEVFRSKDGGHTWKSLDGMKGKSVHALHLAPSNPKVLVAGALDGVYRSNDMGDHWSRISPEDHAGIKDIASIAVDPQNPDVVYAGTWHLAWKT